MKWLRVSLQVNGELAEAVADVLARYIPNGIVIEQDLSKTRSADEDANLTVFGYLPLDGETEALRQKIEEALWYLGRIQPLPSAKYQPIPELNSVDSWKANYHPIPVGEKLIILPAWVDNPDPDRLPLLIEPGMAFGTGTHPTTQLAIRCIERCSLKGKSILDIGCGSGILSIAASLLGSGPSLGVDIDPDAIRAAQANAVLNSVQNKIDWKLGSVAELQAGKLGLRRAPVVVANILSHILIELLDEGLADLVEPGGVLILSGILDESERALLTALEHAPLIIQERIQQTDWMALILRRPR